MIFTYKQEAWRNLDMGECNCFLQTNARGGFQTLSLIGSAARQDHAFFMSAKKAPNVRFHYITTFLEEITIDGESFLLTSQKMYEEDDLRGFRFLVSFTYDSYPTWIFQIGDVLIQKRMLMCRGEEKVALEYQVLDNKNHSVALKLTPLLRFTMKNQALDKETSLKREVRLASECICVDDDLLYFRTNGKVEEHETRSFGPMYFTQDERDGREKTGCCFYNHFIFFDLSKEKAYVMYANERLKADETFDILIQKRKEYESELLKSSPVKSELARQLVISSDAFVVERESTNGMTIIAGYPFFEDWGRDTMISLYGTTLVTRRFDICKSLLETFAKYEKDGLLPNLFPEGDQKPMYNSVDAPLLFINAVYEYYLLSKDEACIRNLWDTMTDIVQNYQEGTKFHIGMDIDGLIKAGDDLEQLTWMDVRVGNYLPTPRHGKPVEVNAYWYNALCIMSFFAKQFSQEDADKEKYQKQAIRYEKLAVKVKASFLAKFWNEKEDCLKDVLNGTLEENQVRCNQIWTLTLPFTMLSMEQERKIIEKVKSELYTTAGLRTLSRNDAAFHGIYIGGMVNRDRAYHQGTVWAYPLGAYYKACIRYLKKSMDAALYKHVEYGIASIYEWLQEGCIGHLAEIYDGEEPGVSRGCFAQAWSDAELLTAVYEWEKMQETI